MNTIISNKSMYELQLITLFEKMTYTHSSHTTHPSLSSTNQTYPILFLYLDNYATLTKLESRRLTRIYFCITRSYYFSTTNENWKNRSENEWMGCNVLSIFKWTTMTVSSRKRKTPNIKKVVDNRKSNRKSKWQKELFMEIWNTRPHVCSVCTKYIWEPFSYCFAHWLSKWVHPEHKFNPDNIFLVCSIECHKKLDSYFSHKSPWFILSSKGIR